MDFTTPIADETGSEAHAVSSRNSSGPVEEARAAVLAYDKAVGTALTAIDRKQLYPMLAKLFAGVAYLQENEEEKKRFRRHHPIQPSLSSIPCYPETKWFLDQMATVLLKSRVTKIASAIQLGLDEGDTPTEFRVRLTRDGGYEGLYSLYAKAHRDETTPSKRQLNRLDDIKQHIEERGIEERMNVGDHAIMRAGFYVSIISVREGQMSYHGLLYPEDDKRHLQALARAARE